MTQPWADRSESDVVDHQWESRSTTHFSDYPAIDSAMLHSRRILSKISDALANTNLDPRIHTIAVSGSLGRMEAVAGSDCDLIVVLQGKDDADTSASAAWESVWRTLAPIGLKRPRADGVFATVATISQLLDASARGRIDEAIPTFGKRFQLLWDAQPVCLPENFKNLMNGVIDWYTATPSEPESPPWWRYLLNDLMRYYRSLSVNCQWDGSRGAGRQRMRSFKMAHSRAVMYAALLGLLGECSRIDNSPTSRLQSLLTMTPLRRLAFCYDASGENGFEIVAGCYERFIEMSDDDEFRRQLTHDEQEIASPAVQRWIQNGNELRSELARFLLQQMQNRWPGNFSSALLV